MKYILTITLLFSSLFSNGQNKGSIYYENIPKNNQDIEEIKKSGLIVEIAPLLINIDSFPEVNKLLNDYISYISRWYSQIRSIKFLDAFDFRKLNTKNMRVQNLCYIQYKNKDYKWGGCNNFEIFHVGSDLYFTTQVKEFKDYYQMNVVVAEKIN